MIPHRILLRCLLFVSVFSAALHSQTASDPEEKVLADFSSPGDVKKFRPEFLNAETGRVPRSPDADTLAAMEKEYLVETDWVSEPSRTGAGAMEVRYAEGGPGSRGYRLLFFHLARMGATDWTGWDALEIDVLNPGEEAVTVRVDAFGAGGDPERPGRRKLGKNLLATRQIVPPGWHRISVSTRGPWRGLADAEVDRSAISNLSIGKWPGEPEAAVLYIDQVRLVRELPGRVERLTRQLEGMAAAPSEVGAELRKALAGTDLPELRRRAGALAAATAGDAEADAIEAKIGEAEALERNVAETAEALRDVGLKALTKAFARAGHARPEGHFVRPLDRPGITEAQKRLAALEALERSLDARLAVTRLQARVDATFAEADFALGVPEYPKAWYARPKDYDGPLRTKVALSAARNEFEPFQILLLPKERPLRDVRIEASDLAGPGTIASEAIEIAPMGWQWMPGEERWLATMLRPDITGFDVAAGVQQPVWCNLYVPRDTPRGDYTGTVTVRAAGMRAETVEVRLTVRPFTLPDKPSFMAFGASPLTDDYARFLIGHRWNPHQLYQTGGTGKRYDTFRQWEAVGGTNFNLFWIDHGYKDWHTLVKRDAAGKPVAATDHAKRRVFHALDPVLQPILENDPSFIEHFMVYGFDEPLPGQMPVLEDLFGAIKERYGSELRTYFATHYPMWEQYGIADHIDIWAITPNVLTHDAMRRLKEAGREVIAYNIRSTHLDPVGVRVQFWSYFKDGFDGVLHYNPGTTGGEGVGRTNEPWEDSLFPGEKRADRGLHRIFPEDQADERSPYGWHYRGRTMSTVAFEYWREAMEDIEYLFLLQKGRDRLAASVGTDDVEALRLLEEADRWLDVPAHITLGAIGGQIEVEGELVRGISGNTEDMAVLLDARARIADLIAEVRELL